ncbi:prepilin-type N-terminal cleavage/methylation domain-containing protein [Patescibacteria group bacterium]|nr:MAG: prepilin-type N-terminal cleavage/methylation domain-containing protein [Patescibacteria group bacterium]
MVLSNIKSRQQERGFTIVELLIVIVVIAILAGITIVAYSGITARAQQSKIQQTAANVQGVAEAFNADKGYYPALAATGTDALALGSTSTKIPSGITIVKATGTPPADTAITSASTPSSGNPTLDYACLTTCTASTGGRIGYWDPVAGSEQFIYVGAASASGTFVYPAS